MAVGAAEPSLRPRGAPRVTSYGELLDSLPLSLPAARLAIEAAGRGMLREGCLVAAIVSGSGPSAITRPFRQEAAHEAKVSGWGVYT